MTPGFRLPRTLLLPVCALVSLLAAPVYAPAANSGGTMSGNNYIGTPTTSPASGANVSIDSPVTNNVYGGKHDSANVTDNTATMAGGSANWLLGGYSNSGDSTDNTVNVSGGTLSSGVTGGESGSGNARNNSVSFDKVTATYLQGGYSASGSATGNNVLMKGGTAQQIFGGYSDNGEATGNTIVIDGGNATSVAGGSSPQGNATNNTVTINGGTVSQDIRGGYTEGNFNASGNSIIINGGEVASYIVGGIVGASDKGSASGNSVTITSGKVTGSVIGGKAYAGAATGNVINLSSAPELGGTTLFGGYSESGDAFTGNVLNKNSDTTVDTAQNFATVNFTYNGDANIKTLDSTPTGSCLSGVTVNTNDNTVALGGVIKGSGSLAKTGAGVLTLTRANTYTGNTMISAGTLRLTNAKATGAGAVTVGASATNRLLRAASPAPAVLELAFTGNYSNSISGSGGVTTDAGSGNTLTLDGTNTYTGMTTVRSGTLALGSNLASNQLTLNGGTTFNQGTYSHSLNNGVLNVNGANGQSATYTGNLSATNATLNFISPLNPSQPLLHVTGTSDVTGSAYNVGLDGGTSLAKGSTLTLLKSDGALTANNLHKGNGIIRIGSTVAHDITDTITVDPATGTIMATVPQGEATQGAKALGWLGGMALSLQGADLIAGRGMESAIQAARNANNTGFAGFGALSGGSLRYNTGSHVDMTSLSLLTGLARGLDLTQGRLTVGAFFEYGNGSYDTHNSFSNAASSFSVDGDGDMYYLGGGLLARMDFTSAGPGTFYAEGSARAGKTQAGLPPP